MGTSQRALTNAILNGGSVLLQLASALVTWAVIARTLGPANTGIYSYMLWLVSVLLLPAHFGLPTALTKYISEYLGRGDRPGASVIAYRLLRVQLCLVLAVAGAGAMVVVYAPGIAHREMLLLSLLLLIPVSFRETVNGVLSGAQRYDSIALLSLVASLVQVGGVLAAACVHAGVAGMLAALLLSASTASLLGWRLIGTALPGRQAFLPSALPVPQHRILHFMHASFWTAVLYAVLWQRSEVFFLGRYSSSAQVAFYAMAFAAFDKLQALAASFTEVIMPLASERYGASGMESLASMFTRSLRYLQMLLVPLCGLGMALARPFVQLMYGDSYLPVVPVMQVLLGALAITVMGGLASSFLFGSEKPATIAGLWTPLAALDLVLAFVVVPKWGALGAAVVKAAVLIPATIAELLFVASFVRQKFPWRATLRIYLAAMVALTPVALAGFMHLHIAILAAMSIIAGVIYIVMLRTLKEVGRAEAELISGLLLRQPSPAPLPAARQLLVRSTAATH